MNVLTFGALAVAGVAAQANIYTATKSADVAAAQATAKTNQPTSHVPGKVRTIAAFVDCHITNETSRSSIVS